MAMKNSNDTSWDRASDLPICATAVMMNYKLSHIWCFAYGLLNEAVGSSVSL